MHGSIERAKGRTLHCPLDLGSALPLHRKPPASPSTLHPVPTRQLHRIPPGFGTSVSSPQFSPFRLSAMLKAASRFASCLSTTNLSKVLKSTSIYEVVESVIRAIAKVGARYEVVVRRIGRTPGAEGESYAGRRETGMARKWSRASGGNEHVDRVAKTCAIPWR